MTCVRSFLTSAALGAACLALAATPLSAQQPVPTLPASPTPLASYRAPVIALVQPALPPAGTGSVPRDRPAVVFRFAAGEPDDATAPGKGGARKALDVVIAATRKLLLP